MSLSSKGIWLAKTGDTISGPDGTLYVVTKTTRSKRSGLLVSFQIKDGYLLTAKKSSPAFKQRMNILEELGYSRITEG